MVVLRGNVEASSSDSYSAQNSYSCCYWGEQDDDISANLFYPPVDYGEPGNCKVAVFADYSYLSKCTAADIDDLMAEASKIFQDNFEFGLGQSYVFNI
jgi:hypothetical protein